MHNVRTNGLVVPPHNNLIAHTMDTVASTPHRAAGNMILAATGRCCSHGRSPVIWYGWTVLPAADAPAMFVATWSKYPKCCVSGQQQVRWFGKTSAGAAPPISEAHKRPTPRARAFQSPIAIAQRSAAEPHTLATVSRPCVIRVCGAWIATTQSSGQSFTGGRDTGGRTRATANARVSQSPRRQPPPEAATCQPGAKANAAESPRWPALQGPSTWAQPLNSLTGRLMP
mmetsp:Transcript_90494/g.277125  ORF Transcript_90494/g.277125 Transcript_90494/m.277125 type:complete len:228 (+) Transcript_90494:181-864(+)